MDSKLMVLEKIFGDFYIALKQNFSIHSISTLQTATRDMLYKSFVDSCMSFKFHLKDSIYMPNSKKPLHLEK